MGSRKCRPRSRHLAALAANARPTCPPPARWSRSDAHACVARLRRIRRDIRARARVLSRSEAPSLSRIETTAPKYHFEIAADAAREPSPARSCAANSRKEAAWRRAPTPARELAF